MRELICGARPAQILAVLAIALTTLASSLPAAQDGVAGQTKLVTTDAYARILDSIFPHEGVPSLKVAYTMVMRFEPNQGPESQFLFRVWHDGHLEAMLYKVMGGSAWDLTNAYISKTGTEDIAAIAESIQVEKRQLAFDSAAVERWHAGLFDILRKSDSQLQKAAAEYAKDGSRDAMLDGTRYEFWYSQGETVLHWAFSDIDMSDLPTRAKLPLARWMNAVRMAFTNKR